MALTVSGTNQRHAWHYTPPTADELCRLLKKWKLSEAEAARITDVTGRTMRRYCAGDAPTPYPVLYVLAAEHGGVLVIALWMIYWYSWQY